MALFFYALHVAAVGASVQLMHTPCDNSTWVQGAGSSVEAFTKVPAASVLDCCSKCTQNKKCGYFTYSPKNTDSCHLKEGVLTQNKVNRCASCVTSGCAGCTVPPFPPPAPPSPPPPSPPTPPPQPAAPGSPNILLLFPDQWRYDWDGLVRSNQPDIPGPLLHVPTTRKVAAAGTRFTTAYVPAAVCAPSRSCLASGREYDHAGVRNNGFDFPVNETTFYMVLRQRGYHVMTTGKDDLTKASQLGSKTGYPGCPTCVDGDGQYRTEELGFSDALRYSGKMDVVDKPEPHEMYGFYLRNRTFQLNSGANLTGWDAHRACMGKMGKENQIDCINSTFPSELYEDDFTANNAIKLLQRKPKGVPWFLHVSFPGPHDPFLVTTDMRNAASDGRNWPNGTDNPTDGSPGGACSPVDAPTGTRTRCNYAAEIENLDKLFQLVLDQVEEQGETNNTIVCIASDHGEMLGDHGDVDKSKPWEGASHVPLMCAGPGILKGQTVEAPVATMDMAGTFMDYASAIPAPGMTTRSLRPLLEGKAAAVSQYRQFVSTGLGNWRLVVKDIGGKQYKYICCQGPCPNPPSTAPQPKTKNSYVEMLIDIIADPYDMHDLAPTERAVVEQMRPLLPPAFAVGCGGGGGGGM